MKKAFSTLCCLSASPEEVLALAVNNCMQGVEVRTDKESMAFGTCTVSDAKHIRDLFEAEGVKITDLALSCSIREYDENEIAVGKVGIDFASALGSHAVRVFVGAAQAHFSDRVNNDIDGIGKAVSELAAYGKEKDVEVWLETHSSFSSGKAMRGLLNFIACDNVRVIWDVIHSLEYREAPDETVRELGNFIAHIHIKDGVPSADTDSTQFIHTDLGKGIVSPAEVIKALKEINYNGFYSLEWESPWRNEIRDLCPDVNDLLGKYIQFLA